MKIEPKQHKKPVGLQPRRVKTLLPGLKERDRAENFIKHHFKQDHGAEIHHFMPLLMSLNDQHNNMLAVLGFCHANPHPLFLENYFNLPVEQVLASKIRQPVDRSSLVEVGNLAVTKAGGGRWLITALTAYLSTTGAEWALFTIGPVLINAFNRLGLELIELGEAKRECLPMKEQAHWGKYYEQKPKVMAGNIGHGYQALQTLCQKMPPMRALWLCAEHAGRHVA
jgi:hypothetical protein